MTRQRRKDTLIWGIILIVIGLIFILENMDVDAWDLVAKLWPVVLIIWGAYKLYYGLKERKEEEAPKPDREQT
jgi:uncharacterized membrane protein HdeD (DUF308 family)